MDPLKQSRIDAGLERIAAELGDITAPVLEAFYGHWPDARASFVHHEPRNPAKLEAEMVGNALYYVMTWFSSPREAEFALGTSVPHHRVALGVPPEWYRGFIEAFFETAEPVLAQTDHATQAAFAEVRQGLVGLVESNRFV